MVVYSMLQNRSVEQRVASPVPGGKETATEESEEMRRPGEERTRAKSFGIGDVVSWRHGFRSSIDKDG